MDIFGGPLFGLPLPLKVYTGPIMTSMGHRHFCLYGLLLQKEIKNYILTAVK